MSIESTVEKSAVNGIRTALGIGGVLAVIVGILILAWPGKTAMVVTAIIAIYAIVAGLVYAGLGIFAKTKGGWARVGHIALGVLFWTTNGLVTMPSLVPTSTLARWQASTAGLSSPLVQVGMLLALGALALGIWLRHDRRRQPDRAAQVKIRVPGPRA